MAKKHKSYYGRMPGWTRFERPEPQPHSSKCDCISCKTTNKLIARLQRRLNSQLNPNRTTDEKRVQGLSTPRPACQPNTMPGMEPGQWQLNRERAIDAHLNLPSTKSTSGRLQDLDELKNLHNQDKEGLMGKKACVNQQASGEVGGLARRKNDHFYASGLSRDGETEATNSVNRPS